MNSSQIGDLCEMIALARLVEDGRIVTLPFGNQLNWDLLAETDNGWEKFQVKSVHARKSGSFEVDCIKSGDTRGNRSTNRKYADGSFDWLIAVHYPTKRMWKIPFSVVFGRRSLVLSDDYKW